MDIKTHYTNLSKREADIVLPAVNKQPDYMVGRPETLSQPIGSHWFQAPGQQFLPNGRHCRERLW